MKNLENKSILFLSLSGIGNFLMQLPAIEAYKKARRNWRIVVWVAPRGTKKLAQAQPCIDEVIEMPIKGNLLQHVKNISVLRSYHFDAAIVLSPGQLLKSAAYLKLSGIPARIGNTYSLKNKNDSKLFLTDAIEEDATLHDIEQNLSLLEPLDIPIQTGQPYSFIIPEKNIAEASTIYPPTRRTRRIGGQPTTSYVGLHLGSAAGFEWKRWPLEHFAEVAQVLIQKNKNIRILVVGSKEEEEQKQQLIKMINKKTLVIPAREPESTPWIPGSAVAKAMADRQARDDNTVAFSVSASLLTTAAVIQKCSLFISNDSGLMHVAAALGVPTVGLFGPTDETHTGPRGSKSYVVRAPGTQPVYNTEHVTNLGNNAHESMLAITPEVVLDTVDQILR